MENDLEKIEICKGNSFLIIEHAVDNLIEWLTRFKEKEVNLGHKITDRIRHYFDQRDDCRNLSSLSKGN